MIIKDNNGIPEPYSIKQFKTDNANVSFREGYPDIQINQYGVYKVQPVPQPAYNNLTHKLERGTPTKTGDIWSETWDIIALQQSDIDRRALDEADRQDKEAIKADNAVKALILATPIKIENYISKNVTDLASAKDLLITLAKAVSAIGKREFR
ncbi:MAG: hypothetical protein COB22_05835 [Cycloclasticus sp.]|nr:MAG: hypothetical protein COB22_05835 [Cycloclasticus sp.]